MKKYVYKQIKLVGSMPQRYGAVIASIDKCHQIFITIIINFMNFDSYFNFFTFFFNIIESENTFEQNRNIIF